MKKLTNTSKNPRPEWLMGGNPSAIEAQEAQGQRELVQSQQLPREINGDGDVKSKYESIGINVIRPTEGDDLFYDVELPKGWLLKATNHSMWSDLIDDKGSVRAKIFYKAAFYDRRSFISFEP